ncbi:hypothetical protein Tco_0028907, partial [Tanacetum coccineum]
MSNKITTAIIPGANMSLFRHKSIDEEDVNSMDEEEDDQKQEDFGENGDGEKGEDNPLDEEELVKSFGDGKYSDEKMERSVDPFNIY